jgi:hypothetical protein
MGMVFCMNAIATLEQALLFANAQMLVNRWNNIVILADTGEKQLEMMKASGVFAEDLQLVFDFGDQKMSFSSLDEPKEFYNSFVNGLKKKRYNLASNVEPIEFADSELKFRFKHWMFFGDKLSLVGDNECVMRMQDGSCFITSALIRAIHFDAQHAY